MGKSEVVGGRGGGGIMLSLIPLVAFIYKRLCDISSQAAAHFKIIHEFKVHIMKIL